MFKRLIVAILGLGLLLHGPADARNPRGASNAINFYQIPAARTTTWMPGLSYAPTSGQFAPIAPPTGWTGGIPTNYTQSGTTISPSGGDDTTALNAALATAGAAASASTPKFVQLACGQFTISGQGLKIAKAYVELIGCGPGAGMKGALATLPSSASATLLVKSDGGTNQFPVITIGSILGSGAGTLNTLSATSLLTADAAAGATTLTVTTPANLSGMVAGELVFLDELFDPTIVWYNENGSGQGSGFRGWGEQGNAASDAASRPIGQALEVASFNAGTGVVTFTTPFSKTYRTAFSAHLGRIAPTNRANWSGVTKLFVTGGDGGDGGGSICIGSAMYAWIANVEVSGHDSAATGSPFHGGMVHIFNSFRTELRDSYLHGDAGDIALISPGGGFYNIVVDTFTSDSLVENNISWIGNKVIVMRSAGSGNVVAYNYMDDGYGFGYLNQMETGLNQDHMAGTHHTLFEGNYSWQLGTDSRWGNQLFATWFRNWSTGMRASAWPSTLIPVGSTAASNPLIGLTGSTFFYEDGFNRNPAKIGSYHFFYSFVGNVLGFTGNPLLTSPQSTGTHVVQTATAYEWFGPSTPGSTPNTTIPEWTMGVGDGGELTSPTAQFTGFISGTTLTAVALANTSAALIEPGLFMTGTGVTAGTFVTGFGSTGLSFTGSGQGGVGSVTYPVNNSQTVGSSGTPTTFTLTYGGAGNGLNQTVQPTTLRDANFDYFTGAVHWHGIGGSGVGQTTPPGASASGGTTLPNSLYITSKPAWFHSLTWPWVDGSNASNPLPGSLPAKSRFDLGTPNAI